MNNFKNNMEASLVVCIGVVCSQLLFSPCSFLSFYRESVWSWRVLTASSTVSKLMSTMLRYYSLQVLAMFLVFVCLSQWLS